MSTDNKNRGAFEVRNVQATGKEFLDIKKYNPNRNAEYIVDVRDPVIWSGFPWSERFLYSLCCKTGCCSDYKHGKFFINECLQTDFIRDPKLDTLNKVLCLSILKSGTLEIEPMIVHPFVRISIVNLTTGKYVQKYDFLTPSISRHETNFIMQQNQNQNKIDLQTSLLDFIPPVTTCPYDLREKGESFAEWNEDFYINESLETLWNANVIYFFELMDYNLDFGLNSTEDCMIPMAWGYLKPVGFSSTYIGKHKIQWYKHKFTRGADWDKLKKTNFDYVRTPDVLYELDWIRKEKYQTFLQIQLQLVDRPSKDDIKKPYFHNKFIYSVFVEEGDNIDIHWQKFKRKEKDEVEQTAWNKKIKLLKWLRNSDEMCQIPNQILYKFPTARLGCLTHEFSDDGKYIAAACTELSSETTIKIFNVEDGILRYHFKGHHQIIHDLKWCNKNQIWISCSADNNITLWRIPKEESNDILNVEFLDNESKFKITSISHPAYVYSIDIFPNENKVNDPTRVELIIATACFDGIVRLYNVKLQYNEDTNMYYLNTQLQIEQIVIGDHVDDNNYFEKWTQNIQNQELKRKDKAKIPLLNKTALDHRHPNSIIFDKDGQWYIGDSLGYIHIWEFSIIHEQPKLTKVRIFTHKELECDTINKIIIPQSQTKRLIVHSRDNCIRLVDISTDKPKVILRYFGSKCMKTNIKSTISPDNSFILSGSEEGIPQIWALESGIGKDTSKFECGFIDSVNDVSWNNKYNMTALSAFGQEYPLLVHVFEKDEITIDKKDLKLKRKKKNNNNNNNDPNKMFSMIPEEDETEAFNEKPNQDYYNSAPNQHFWTPGNNGFSSQFANEYSTLIKKDLDEK